MPEKLVRWFREDPFGPEMFGLIVEFFLFVVIARVIVVLWRRARRSSRLRDIGAELSAKYSRVRDATLDLVRVIEYTIKKAELLQPKYGVASEDLRKLLRDELSDLGSIPRELTQAEKDTLREVRDRYISEAFDFREASERGGIIIDTLGEKHNLNELIGLVTQVEAAVKTIHRYSVRENLISDFKSDALPIIDRLLASNVSIGNLTYSNEK